MTCVDCVCVRATIVREGGESVKSQENQGRRATTERPPTAKVSHMGTVRSSAPEPHESRETVSIEICRLLAGPARHSQPRGLLPTDCGVFGGRVAGFFARGEAATFEPGVFVRAELGDARAEVGDRAAGAATGDEVPMSILGTCIEFFNPRWRTKGNGGRPSALISMLAAVSGSLRLNCSHKVICRQALGSHRRRRVATTTRPHGRDRSSPLSTHRLAVATLPHRLRRRRRRRVAMRPG